MHAENDHYTDRQEVKACQSDDSQGDSVENPFVLKNLFIPACFFDNMPEIAYLASSATGARQFRPFMVDRSVMF